MCDLPQFAQLGRKAEDGLIVTSSLPRNDLEGTPRTSLLYWVPLPVLGHQPKCAPPATSKN